MDIQGYFTTKGLLLAAKLAAGSTLKITRVCAGAAETAMNASALSQIRQTLSVGAARRDGDTAVLPVTLTAGLTGSAYTLRELGVYAQDPDEGEILYKVYRLSEPVAVNPSSRLVLRFYLEETVSQDLNVTVVRASAGLLTEADLEPVKNRLEAVHVPSRTVEVAAADLRQYIASLPRLLTENLTITVLGGTCSPDGVYICNFYGPGRLTVRVAGGAEVTCPLVMKIEYCTVPITVERFRFEGPSEAGAYVQVIGCNAYIKGIIIDGANKNHEGGGVAAIKGGYIFLERCEIKNTLYALVAQEGARLVAYSITASGNTYGVASSGGAIVSLAGNTQELVGGNSHGHWGGAIFNKNGELI